MLIPEVSTEHEIMREAEEVLVKHLGPAKATRFWVAFSQGAGDYLQIKERLFEGETVETLYQKVQQYEKDR